jgi:hypothetical protein
MPLTMTPENPAFGGTALRIPAINSPNFNLQNPAASPQPSWAILQNGLAYFFGLTVTGGTITGPDYVINASGFFFYSGAPAAGALIYSIARSAGTDPYGNPYYAGATSYFGSTSELLISGAALYFALAGTIYAQLTLSGTGILTLRSTGGASSFALAIPVSSPITASDPASPTVLETWHAITLDAGWAGLAGYAAPSYMVLPDGNLQLTGLADFGSVVTANHNLNNGHPLPAAYRPLTTKQYRSSDANTQRGAVQINNAGVITFLASAAAPARYCEIDAVLPLNL